MIGIAFSYPDAADRLRHPPWTELRVARIEPGPPNTVWLKGEASHEVCYYWRNWDIPLEERTRLMEDIVKKLIKEHKVDGFTLWWNWTKKVWQMNHRFADEGGWSISHITQAQAEAIFSTLEASHPDGPWKVKDEYVQDDKTAREEVAKLNTSSAAFRHEQSIAGDMKTYDEQPAQLSLDDALRQATEAVERGIAVLGKLVP